MEYGNLKFLLQHGQESMSFMQIADAFREAGLLIKRVEELEKQLKLKQ